MPNQPSLRKHQGATLVFVALWMGIVLAALMALDIGNLVWQKRELQKIADLSALAGARYPVASSCATESQMVASLNGLAAADVFLPSPGHWGVSDDGSSYAFQSGATSPNACEVIVKRVVNYFFVWPASAASGREIMAMARAAAKSPQAQLSVYSQLLNIDSEKSRLLNVLVGSLLGGSLYINAMGWEGLAGANVNLLEFLPIVRADLGLEALTYEELLQEKLQIGDLLEVVASVLRAEDKTAQVSLDALASMAKLGLRVDDMRITLAELLHLKAGREAALDASVNALDLVMATVQIGNSNSGLSAGVELPLGIANVAVALKVVEPPQLSLSRDPELAKREPYAEDTQIYARTAQTRLLISADIPVVGAVTDVVNGLLTLLSPVVNLVNLLTGGVNLFGPVEYMSLRVLPSPFRLDISVDLAAGHARLMDYHCEAGQKTVTMDVRRAAGDIRVGRWGDTLQEARSNAFSSTSLAVLQPAPVVRMDCIGCDGKNVVTPQYFGGLGLQLDVPLVANQATREADVPDGEGFSEPQNVDGAPNIIASLGRTVLGLKALSSLKADARASPAGLNGIMDLVSTLLGGVLGAINSLLVTVLAPLLDPVLNGLLSLLGANLTESGVSARLTCGGGAELVY